MDDSLFTVITLLLIFSILLIILSAVFSLFDSALGFCRKSRLEKESGKRYKAVLVTLENPKRISLTCRLWINILRVFAAFWAGISASYIAVYNDIGISNRVSIYLSLFIIGLFAALFGDALPRLISKTRPEKIAASLLPIIKILSFPMIPFTLPALKFASFFKTAFKAEIDDNNITEEELQDELRNTLIEGEKSGIVESKERDMVEGVFYLGDRPVGAFMTHRSEIQWLDINMPYNEIREKALASKGNKHRSQLCFPVADGSPDEIAGSVYLEDIILDLSQPNPQGLRAIMKKALFVPETMTALKAFESFKHGQTDFLFVMDEYGGLAGIISIRALVEEIVGELSLPAANKEPLVRQEDGSFIADGTLNIDDAAKALSLTDLPAGDDFHTLAGFILHLAGELPVKGDSCEYQGYRFTVKEMDGNRIDKLIIKKIEIEN
ncbi:MAG: hemolysin family protein [Treponema sp.]|nr:hemolysin family protein [Treponema sp.]